MNYLILINGRIHSSGEKDGLWSEEKMKEKVMSLQTMRDYRWSEKKIHIEVFKAEKVSVELEAKIKK